MPRDAEAVLADVEHGRGDCCRVSVTEAIDEVLRRPVARGGRVEAPPTANARRVWHGTSLTFGPESSLEVDRFVTRHVLSGIAGEGHDRRCATNDAGTGSPKSDAGSYGRCRQLRPWSKFTV